MCIALPATLLPQKFLFKLGLISQIQQEKWALTTGCFCAKWLFRLIPFCNVDVTTPYYRSAPEAKNDDDGKVERPQPSIWVCNHSSALDIFLLLANDWKLRGKHKRPIKIVYVSIDFVFALFTSLYLCFDFRLLNGICPFEQPCITSLMLFSLLLMMNLLFMCITIYIHVCHGVNCCSGNNWKTIRLQNCCSSSVVSFLFRWPPTRPGRTTTTTSRRSKIC